MATRLAGFVYTQSTGAIVSGATVTPRASDGTSSSTDTTNSAGFVAFNGLADKTWFGTVASSSQVFVPATETWVNNFVHNESGRLSAHDFAQIRGKLIANQINSGSAAEGDVLTSDGAGNATFEESPMSSVKHATATVTSATTTTIATPAAGKKILVFECDAFCSNANTNDTNVEFLLGSTRVRKFTGVAKGSGFVVGAGGGRLAEGVADEAFKVTTSDPGGTVETGVSYREE